MSTVPAESTPDLTPYMSALNALFLHGKTWTGEKTLEGFHPNSAEQTQALLAMRAIVGETIKRLTGMTDELSSCTLMLTGDPGVGKSHLVKAAVAAVLRKMTVDVGIGVHDDYMKLRKEWSQDDLDKKYKGLLHRIVTPPWEGNHERLAITQDEFSAWKDSIDENSSRLPPAKFSLPEWRLANGVYLMDDARTDTFCKDMAPCKQQPWVGLPKSKSPILEAIGKISRPNSPSEYGCRGDFPYEALHHVVFPGRQPFMVLDDLGAQHRGTEVKDWPKEIFEGLARVINDREEQGSITVITSNCRLEDLLTVAHKISPATESRLAGVQELYIPNTNDRLDGRKARAKFNPLSA